jgi:hypothetical protein
MFSKDFQLKKSVYPWLVHHDNLLKNSNQVQTAAFQTAEQKNENQCEASDTVFSFEVSHGDDTASDHRYMLLIDDLRLLLYTSYSMV